MLHGGSSQESWVVDLFKPATTSQLSWADSSIDQNDANDEVPITLWYADMAIESGHLQQIYP